eukprot:14333243-Alexandrium_andersonii.AAC.1
MGVQGAFAEVHRELRMRAAENEALRRELAEYREEQAQINQSIREEVQRFGARAEIAYVWGI